jgi:nitroreductase
MADSVLDAIHRRRSYGRLGPPAPNDAQLRDLVAAAVAAPDHGRLRPWRFVAVRPEAYTRLGEVLADALRARHAAEGIEPTPAQLDKEHTKLGRAPLVVVAAARYQPGPIPRPEQLAAVAAATQNLILAAEATGFGSMWRTGPAAYDDRVKEALGLDPTDGIVGFVYLGTVPDGRRLPPAVRPAPADVLDALTGTP